VKISRRELLKLIGVSTIYGSGSLNSQALFADNKSNFWSLGPNLETPIQEIYPTVFRGEIYVSGGFVPSNNAIFFGLAPTNRVFIYSPQNRSWRRGAELPEVRHHLGMVSNSQYIYGIGGFYGDTGNAWQAKDTVYRATSGNQPWQPGPSLPFPMAESVYAPHKENIHVIGGKTLDKTKKQNIDTDNHFVLVNNENWEKAAPATVVRNSAASAVLDGKVYVVGGRQSGRLARNLQYAEVYDEKNDRWQSIRPLPKALAGITAVSLNGKIVVTGGEAFGPNGNWRTGKALDNIWSYDPATDLWTEKARMPQPRHGHGAVIIDNKIYLVGGASKVGPQKTLSSLLIIEELSHVKK